MLKRVLLIMFLAGLSTAVRAQDFGLDLGCCSQPLTDAPVFVNGNGGGVSAYFNSIPFDISHPNNSVITDVTFVVDAGLGKNNNSFRCASPSYFRTCQIAYDSGTGLVTFHFTGATPDGDETPTDTDNEVGEFEGVPSVPTGCLFDPYSPDDETNCRNIGGFHNDKGHFLISFNTLTGEEGNAVNPDPNGHGTWAPGTIAALVNVNGSPVLTLNVDISIKPNAPPPVPINAGSRGTIPVAILSTPRFNALTSVDTSSLKFGRTGSENSLQSCDSAGEDVNGDGLPDLVCHFGTQSAGFHSGDSLGILNGKITLLGLPIVGREAITIVP